MSRSQILPGAVFSRLIRHTTTIDPYLDESGPSARRLGAVTLDGVTYDAIDLSETGELTAEIRTAARATVRVPCAVMVSPRADATACAVTGSPRADVTFEVTVTPAGEAARRGRTRVAAGGYNRWHEVVLRVPQGPLTLTIRATSAGGPSGAVCGVPSISWRKPPRAVSRSLLFTVRRLGVAGTVRYVRGKIDADPGAQYAAWVACHALTPESLAAARAGAAALPDRPRFLIFLETPPGADPALADATRASLDAQVYREFDICVADNAAERNAGLERLPADFVGAIRAGDRLSPLALLRAAEQAAANADVDVIYTDEDVWPASGTPGSPRFKPDWSPELLETGMYLGRLFLVRRPLAVSAGGYRTPVDGAIDYDLALRVCPGARRIVHVSDVLYHRGTAAGAHGAHGAHGAAGANGLADSADRAAALALADACARRGLPATIVPAAIAGAWRARITVTDSPRIAIVIPTDGRGPGHGAPSFVSECVRSIRQRTQYPHYELLVCDNGNLTADTRAFLDTVPHTRATYRWEGAFNFPRKINFAVAQTDAPYVLLLNDDVEPINRDWLDAMLEYAHQPQIGAVGAKLFYPDGRLQHVGVAVGVCGVAAHLLHQHPGGTQGCGGIAVSVRNCSAVTGACLLTRRQVYDEAGGFDEVLALDFNDVDFCLRVRRAGYRIVFTPHARLFHHESASFGDRRQRAEEVAAMWERWGRVLEQDPYYNVNLSRESADCRIRPCK